MADKIGEVYYDVYEYQL